MGFDVKTNGCGACSGFWAWFKPPHPNFFIEDCNKHDLLYDIGGAYKERLNADIQLFQDMLSRVYLYFNKRKPISKLWMYIVCFMYFIAVRIVGFTRFNYMEGNFLGNLHRKYFADVDYTDGSVGISGFMLAVVRILLTVVLHETLFTYGLKLMDDYTFISWAISVVISFLVSPIVIATIAYLVSKVFKISLPTSFFGNTLKRFLSGAYIPIPYTIIWLFGR